MMFMNELEIDEAVHRLAQHPVMGPAARYLDAFKDEVNAHSDGWPYWAMPVKAAAQLQTLIHAYMWQGRGVYPRVPEPTIADVRRALTPIKRFMTLRGTAAGMRALVLEGE